MFWQGDHAVYREADGYDRIVVIVNKIRIDSSGNYHFCDCGDVLHGTSPAISAHGPGRVK